MTVSFEFSAGGIVTDQAGNLVLVRVMNFAGQTKIALPKGHIEPSESSLVAAIREVGEETGLEVVSMSEKPAKVIEYWFVRRPDRARVKKKVYFYHLEVVGGDPANHDAEVEEVLLVPIADGLELLSYPAEQQVAREVLRS